MMNDEKLLSKHFSLGAGGIRLALINFQIDLYLMLGLDIAASVNML